MAFPGPVTVHRGGAVLPVQSATVLARRASETALEVSAPEPVVYRCCLVRQMRTADVDVAPTAVEYLAA